MKRYFPPSTLRTVPALWALTAIVGAGSAHPARAQVPAAPAVSAQAQPVFGAVAGVVRSAAKVPVVGAMVVAARADGNGIWTTISGNDGIYSIPNVAPGEYLVTAQAEGYPDTAPATLQVTAGRANRADIGMAASVSTPVPSAPAAVSSNPYPPAVNAAPGSVVSNQNLWARRLKDQIRNLT